MSKRRELIDLSLGFLRAVAKATEIELGPNPKRLQQAGWLVHKGSGGTGQHFERLILDRGKVSAFYQMKLGRVGFPEQQSLRDALVEKGIPSNEILMVSFSL